MRWVSAAWILLAAAVLGFLLSIITRRRLSKQPQETLVHNTAPEQPLYETTPLHSQPDKTSGKRKITGDFTPMLQDRPSDIDPPAVKQKYDAFLVLDVEGTCMPGTDFNYANEIIASLPRSTVLTRLSHLDCCLLHVQEWPVCLLRWTHKDRHGKASVLEVVDEFRSFVKPVWRPQLSSFCTSLTGINQVCLSFSECQMLF